MHAAEMIARLYDYIKGIDVAVTELTWKTSADPEGDHTKDFNDLSKRFTEEVSDRLFGSLAILLKDIRK